MFLLKTDLNINKRVKVGLKEVYGFNFSLIQKLCNELGINSSSLLSELKLYHFGMITRWAAKNGVVVSDDLKKFNYDNKKRLILIRCYKGFRHESGLPVRGQRTRDNAKTQKRLHGDLLGSLPERATKKATKKAVKKAVKKVNKKKK